MTTTDTQMPNYETRICPTALVLRTYKNEIYTILIQNLRGHRGWILPSGKIEQNETSIQSALREFNEETGGISNTGSQLISIGSIGTLNRHAGTSARNPQEIALLNKKPQGEKFLFLKQQLYELFIVDDVHGEQIILDSSKRAKDISNCQIIKIIPGDHSRYKDIINLSTDIEVIKIITDYLGQPNKSLDTIAGDINTIYDQVNLQTIIFK